ncbi:MAG: hypothetical protein V3U08_07185, partial [Nitrospirales bacterium]
RVAYVNGQQHVECRYRNTRCLARIIHERFYCNRAFPAATSLHAAAAACRLAGSPLSRSTYRSPVALPEQRVPGTPPSLVAPHRVPIAPQLQWVQRYATSGYPLRCYCNGWNATNRHE